MRYGYKTQERKGWRGSGKLKEEGEGMDTEVLMGMDFTVGEKDEEDDDEDLEG